MTQHSMDDSTQAPLDDIQALRAAYGRAALDESTAPENPFDLFAEWFRSAQAAGTIEPNAMTLATADARGRASARTVLLKGVDRRGLSFFTNREGRKGRELEANPWAALVFWWPPVERQVRVEGRVEPVDDQESDAYWNSRPRGSRLSAWASHQSHPVPDRATLERARDDAAALYPEDVIPRPPYWVGYRVVPDAFEFWQGRPDRLHDRIGYRRDGDDWTRTRLAP